MSDQQTNTNDETADAVEAGEDTALAAAANAEGGDRKDDQADSDKDADTDKPEGDSDADAGKTDDAAVGAPDEYDTAAFQMPEGVEFDAEGFKEVEPILRDLNLNQEQAGKLVGAYAEKVVPLIEARTLKAIDDQGAELRATLARELQDDPEVGGKKLDESRSYAAKAIAHFIPDKNDREGFSKFLNETGFGNQRFLMRIVAGAGRAISEATTVAGETASKPTSEAEKFYGKG